VTVVGEARQTNDADDMAVTAGWGHAGKDGVPGTSSSGECATGLATLRRDGFASMDAAGSAGKLTTRPVPSVRPPHQDIVPEPPPRVEAMQSDVPRALARRERRGATGGGGG